MGWTELEWSGIGWDELEWPGMVWKGLNLGECGEMSWNGLEYV